MKMNRYIAAILIIALLPFAGGFRAQTIIGGSVPDISSLLDIQSTNKGLLPPRMTAAQRNGIAAPANGLMVFVTDLNCLQVNVGTPAAPEWLCLEQPVQASTNGSAVVTAYGGTGCTGSGVITGDLIAGRVVQGVYMILYADVAQPGEWSLSAAQNGVNFSARGVFSAAGCQPIVLKAAGIPPATGTFTWTTNSTPAGSAQATVGAMTALNCASATNSGTLTAGVAASGVSSSVPYTGGNGAPHSGQTVTSTGVTGLTATLTAGNFASGAGSLTYNITGTPSGAGTASFALNIGGRTCTLTRTVASN